MSRAHQVFHQNDGEVTKAYYQELEERGPLGQIALNLFRAQKRSTAAKNYRGRRFKNAAYEVKNFSIEQLCRVLQEHGASRSITWGWKEDPYTPGFEWVLYVDLPQGQVSFHAANRGQGPAYAGDWDKQRLSRERILAFCDNVLEAKPVPVNLYGIPANVDPEDLRTSGTFMNISRAEFQKPEHIKREESEQVSLFPDVRKGTV